LKNSLPPLDNLDEKAGEAFRNKVVRKHYAASIPELERFPTYVSEYLISLHADENGELPHDAIRYIVDELKHKLFEKRDKEAIKSIAMDLGSVEIIDHFDVFTDLRRGKYYTNVSIIDERATVNKDLVKPSGYQDLLKGGLWGKATFQYTKRGDLASLNMNDFEGYQTTNVIFKRYINNRQKFSTYEWIDFLIRSIGINPDSLKHKQKLLYLCRLIPFVQPFTNLLELGPPGTGKSYIFENISEYCRILVGGEISPAKLIYNQSLKTIGIIFKKDIICFDEINKDNTKLRKVIPKLQQVMASNQIERGDLEARTEASLVFQGNIDFILKDDIKPKREKFLKVLPKDMYDSAFLDRIHIFIHGWKIPRFSDVHINWNLGLIGNYFGQILHKFRREHVSFLIDEKVGFYKIDRNGNKRGLSIRDKKALYNTISGLIKLIYPHKKITDNEWEEIIELAIELRQNIIDEIVKIDETLKREIKYELISTVKKESQKGVDPETLQVDVKKVEKEREYTEEKNLEKYRWSYNIIEVNEKNYLTGKVPYWLLKILVHEELLHLDKNYFKIEPIKDHHGFILEYSDNDPISVIDKTTHSQNYEVEENSIKLIEKAINDLNTQIRKYQKFLRYINYLLFQFPKIGKNNVDLFKKLENKKTEIPIQSNLFLKEILDNLNQSIELIKKSGGMQPDLLSINFDPILFESKYIIEELNTNIKNWKTLNSQFKDLKKVFKKLKNILEKEKETQKRSDLLFKGEKFPFFAVDVNNLMISFHKKYPRISRIKDTPIMKLKKNYFNEKPYRAYFFTSDHLTKYLHPLSQNKYNKFYIEKLYKKGESSQYMDIDTALATKASSFLERYKNQISHFYLGSGDKDFHTLIELAQEYKIPVTMIITEKNNVSIDMEQFLDYSNIEVLY
jgi:ATP-dependent Lon protease